MISLFIDTADRDVIVAILNNSTILGLKKELNQNDLSIKLLPMIDELFKEVHLDIKQVEKVFAVNGPGSFTGIRIGLTAAKVIAWSLNCPIVLLSELEVLSSTQTDKKYIIPVIDARRGYVYGAIYTNRLRIEQKDEYIEYVKLMDNAKDYDAAIISHYDYDGSIKPNVDISKIISKHLKDKGINPHAANPNYLKRTEAEESLEKND